MPTQPPSRPTPPGKPGQPAAPRSATAPGQAASQESVVHHEGSRGKRARRIGPMQLNMTSMIDVVFLLLIYFVITASFVVGEGVITANFPTGSGEAPDPLKLEQPIKIIVSSKGNTGYRLDVDKSPTAPSTFGDLAKMLRGMCESGLYDDENPIIIQPTAQVRWQHVVNAFNAAVAAKFKNIAFAQTGGGEEG